MPSVSVQNLTTVSMWQTGSDEITKRLNFFLGGVHRQVCLFLKRGATQSDEDEDGQDPLSVAVQLANADIVTLCVSIHRLLMKVLVQPL